MTTVTDGPSRAGTYLEVLDVTLRVGAQHDGADDLGLLLAVLGPEVSRLERRLLAQEGLQLQ